MPFLPPPPVTCTDPPSHARLQVLLDDPDLHTSFMTPPPVTCTDPPSHARLQVLLDDPDLHTSFMTPPLRPTHILLAPPPATCTDILSASPCNLH